MAEEENDAVTYTVKITVTLTIPHPEAQSTTFDVEALTVPFKADEAAQAMDVVAETVLLSDDDGLVEGDDVSATEEPDTDRGKQDMDVGSKTASFKDDEGSIEGDDVVDGDSSSVKVPVAPMLYRRRKKKRGRRFAEIQKMKEDEEALMKTVQNGTNEHVKEEKKKPGRKRKEIFSSGEEFEAEQKGGNVTKEKKKKKKKKKKKPGRKRKIISNETEEGKDDEAGLNGENGGFVMEEKNNSGGKINIEDELVGEKKSESDVLKDQDRCEIDTTLSDDNKGYSLRRTAAVKKPKYIEPKVTKLTDRTKWIEEESLMCHQCQRNDKGRVVRCTKCKRKRYCVCCINNWYPHLKEDEIAKACPVCCGNCNCKACLRSTTLIKAIKRNNTETNKDHEVELSKYMLKELLPYLRRLDKEQMVEKEIEAKRQGLSLSELKIEVADCPKNERVYCNNCKTSIFDYHRSCTKCPFDV
ncbi:hypothetical protein P8452_10988 [Trifolium repens]|nr:hypothetical protein P8452_10988 [Trifolium repens]